MLVLGITDGDDGGACIVRDGIILAAVNEERLNRKKQVIGFPSLSIEEVIRLSGIQASDIEAVGVAAISEKFNPQPLENNGWFRTKEGFAKRFRDDISSALAPYVGNYGLAKGIYHKMRVRISHERRTGIPRLLRELGVQAPIRYYNHHLCHALSADHTSGFDSALTLTLDGGGDGSCSHAYLADGRSLRRVSSLDSFHSIGNFYAYVTYLCGFKPAIHEGKITGLAAYGRPEYEDVFSRLISYRDGQIVNTGNVYRWSAIREIKRMLPPSFKLEDLAASIQTVLEKTTLRYIRHWIERSGARNVALAGGVFSNVKLNQMIAELPEIEAIHVFPQMGDGGLAVGAAYGIGAPDRRREPASPRLEDVYLGPAYTDREMRGALDAAGLIYEHHNEVEKEIARLLAAGKVVARFDGKMEFGPRALGNRSILYAPTDPSINDWLNKRLKRTEFMPFAPAVLAEYAGQCFKTNKTSSHATRFMTMTLDCTEWMKRNCPAVVHVDGTARPQMVDQQINSSFYRIIDEFRKITALPCVINTSFNMHEEPIVCNPADAIRAFRLGQLDYLAMGNFVVKNPAVALTRYTPAERSAPGIQMNS
jgi:carbamoyltransferase